MSAIRDGLVLVLLVFAGVSGAHAHSQGNVAPVTATSAASFHPCCHHAVAHAPGAACTAAACFPALASIEFRVLMMPAEVDDAIRMPGDALANGLSPKPKLHPPISS